MQFGIEESYPSISKDLLLRALTYAKTLVNMSDEEINIIMHSKSLCYLKENVRNIQKLK